MTALPNGSCAIRSVTVAGRRFDIAYGDESTSATDPVAAAYRAGWVHHLNKLIQVALRVIEPGTRVLDIGAHLGGFALTAAALGCEVIAIEAAPRNAALLRISAEHNQFTNLHVVEAAVSDESGSIEFSPHGPWGHVATPATGIPSVTVPAIRIDDLLQKWGWNDVHFVKLDVEGSEVRAIRGMRNLLRRSDAPPIFFESNRHVLAFYGESPESLRAELRGLGYQIYHQVPGVLMPVADIEGQQMTVVDYVAAKQLPPRLAAWRRTSFRLLWWQFKRSLHG